MTVRTDRSVPPLHRLLAFVRPYLWKYVVGIASGTLSLVFSVLAPYFLRRTIDRIQAGEAYLPFILGIVAAGLLAGLFSWLQRWVAIGASREVEADIRESLFRHLVRLDFYYYAEKPVGDLMNRLNTDLQAVRDMLGPGINMGFRVTLFIVFAFAAMFLVNPGLAAGVLAVAVPTVLVARYLMHLADRRWREAQEVYDRIAAKAEEDIAGIRVIKGFALEAKEREAFVALNRAYIEKSLALARVEGPLQAAMSLLLGIAVLIVLLKGGGEVVAGRMTLGEFVQFNAYLTLLTWPVLGLGWVLGIFQRGQTSWRRLLELFDEVPRVRDGPETDPGIRVLSGEVVFERVGLRLDERRVLAEIMLRLKPGMTLGVTGRTGSGKTMLARLIPRIIDASEGTVYVGGHPVRKIPIETLRRNVGMAPQEPFLFSESVFDNIAFGLERPDPDRVEWAAKLAGVHEEILRFPKGYDTKLGERGVTLSGGQRQRVALARALAKKPEILILDDALSAVDTETEAKILQGLKGVLGQQTTLIISHRVSALRHADWIVVLEGGRIVEEGTHESLLRLGGHYAELERLQRLEEAL